MKKIFISIISIGLLFSGCSDDDKLPVDFDDLINTGLPFAARTNFESKFKPIENEIFLEEVDIANYSLTTTLELNSIQDGSDVTAIKVVGSFKDNTVMMGGTDISKNDVLIQEIPSSQFTTSGELPEVTFTITGTELLGDFGYTADQIKGTDVFTYQIVLVTANGEFTDVSANFDNQSADHTFNAQVLCPSDFSAEFTYESTNLIEDEDLDVPTSRWATQTGTGSFEEVREGVYRITPGATFGALSLWNDGVTAGPENIFLRDNCGTFSYIGEDSNEDGYNISPLTVNGNELTYTWENDEDQSGTVTLTRTDGMDWPDIE
ncbi:hypothetical protein [Aquimarina algicola]|uniref:Uncharacterized protein n=1 Tax=Aquimarina algicola TaxID=2589995 RepID=A0A504J0V0_9FLAO|nr:hypothetical protein [Aquimarina algicola]TPN81323.1 hypothetical protein FHK87_25390 [Aquimarina algicola]